MEFLQGFSFFEIAMLFCFGASWPFAIAKTYKSKNVEGKSILFLSLVFLGYIMGCGHKIIYNYDFVVYLYVLNGLFVLTEIVLYFMYKNKKA